MWDQFTETNFASNIQIYIETLCLSTLRADVIGGIHLLETYFC